MLEHHVSAKITRKRLMLGPAAHHVDDFSDWLRARGYQKRSLFRMLQSFAGWTDWLTKTGRTDEDFAEGLQECTKHFKSAPHIPYERGPRRESFSVARLFLLFLGERVAKLRYNGGSTSYIEVLTNDTNYYSAQLTLAVAQENEALSIVQLYSALGGGWQE